MWMLVFKKEQLISSSIKVIRNQFNKPLVNDRGGDPKLSTRLLAPTLKRQSALIRV